MFGSKISNRDLLVPPNKCWHRHNSGKRVLATITDIDNNYVKLHYDSHSARHHVWFKIDESREINRFTTCTYYNYDENDNKPFSVNEKVDIFLSYPSRTIGWKPAKIVRFSKNSPQALCIYNETKDRNNKYWVHIHDANEIAKYKTHLNEYICITNRKKDRIASSNSNNLNDHEMADSDLLTPLPLQLDGDISNESDNDNLYFNDSVLPPLPPSTSYEYDNDLISNTNNVYNNNKRDYNPKQCKICKITFKKKASLRKHAKVHSDEKAHKCSKCVRSYEHSSGLKQHFERDHANETPRSYSKSKPKKRKSKSKSKKRKKRMTI